MNTSKHTSQFNRDKHWTERIPYWVLPDGYNLIAVFRSAIEYAGKKRSNRLDFNQELSFFMDRNGLDIMPRKKGQTNAPKTTDKNAAYVAVSWLNLSLTDDDVQRLISLGATDTDLAVDFLTLCGYGYSIGCKPAPSGEGWMAYLTGAASDDANVLVGISGYANTPVDALSSLLFKFHDKLGGVLNKPEPKSARRFG